MSSFYSDLVNAQWQSLRIKKIHVIDLCRQIILPTFKVTRCVSNKHNHFLYLNIANVFLSVKATVKVQCSCNLATIVSIQLHCILPYLKNIVMLACWWSLQIETRSYIRIKISGCV
jgi:hypothetical protein